jgi:hypothetical protein
MSNNSNPHATVNWDQERTIRIGHANISGLTNFHETFRRLNSTFRVDEDLINSNNGKNINFY